MQTFDIPKLITGAPSDHQLARQIIDAWKNDGIFQIAMTEIQNQKTQSALAESKRFFRQSLETKSKYVSNLTYSGYIASGEELTAGKADYSEIFTICKDVPLDQESGKTQLPCHGPVPWPDHQYRQSMNAYMDELALLGDRLLELVAIGLGFKDINTLTQLTQNGWHHMRVLRFPALSQNSSQGIGAHTDYGLLVIAAQDDVGGLYVRPPIQGETRNRNWLSTESAAGMYQDDDGWTFVQPVPKVLTVFPGDMLQFMTQGKLLATPHKVKLNTRERFALAYFHEPHFNACIRPLFEPLGDEYIHYGTHFTNMFMRCYPERITTQQMLKTDHRAVLAGLEQVCLRS